jgi:rhamnosyl/mannosyltransferase
MKILHFYKNALPESIGGVEQVINQIARGTGALGVENTVLSLSNSPSDHPTPMHGYQLITTQRSFELASNGFSWQSINSFKMLAARVDLIHYHFPWPFADLTHQLIKPNIPTVVTYHSDIIRQKLLLKLYRPLKRKFLNSVDHIVATSPNYLLTSNVLQEFSKKNSIIPIGLEPDFYSLPDPEQVKFYQSHFGTRFFLFIGAFRYYKCLEFLIEAAKVLPFSIVIAGSGHSEGEFKAMARKLHLRNIFFLGQVSEGNKSALLEACYGVVLPSYLRSEAFGVTLLEGAMFGKPLISCEIGTGTTYINIDQVTGLVTLPADPKALANAMTWLWTHPEKARQMGQRARERYEALFTAKQMSQSYFELYQKLLNR